MNLRHGRDVSTSLSLVFIIHDVFAGVHTNNLSTIIDYSFSSFFTFDKSVSW
jgi:hypothetical protein